MWPKIHKIRFAPSPKVPIQVRSSPNSEKQKWKAYRTNVIHEFLLTPTEEWNIFIGLLQPNFKKIIFTDEVTSCLNSAVHNQNT